MEDFSPHTSLTEECTRTMAILHYEIESPMIGNAGHLSAPLWRVRL